MLKADLLSDEIFVLDDDPSLTGLLADVLQSDGYRVICFNNAAAFLRVARSRTPACILLDLHLPRRSGVEILRDLDARTYGAPIIIMSGRGNISLAVEATKIGAFDVVEKPFDPGGFSARIRHMIKAWRRKQDESAAPVVVADFPGRSRLTQREREVLAEIAAASSNKEAAAHLGLSPRTIEVHRAHIMMKLGAKNTADLIRMVMGNKPTATRKLS